MLAVFFVFLGTIGIFLNWPVLFQGIFSQLTNPTPVNTLTLSFYKFSQGFTRPDGKIIIITAVVIVISAFLHTNKILLNLRSIILAAVSAMLTGEVLMVLNSDYPLYSYTGLIFTAVFFILSFVVTLLKIGSTRSLNSTLLGKPLSESRSLVQSISKTLDMAASIIKLDLLALDDIDVAWKKNRTREFKNKEIKIGRDKNWADAAVGDTWDAVGEKHGVLKPIGSLVVYEPISKKFAFAVDDDPHQMPRDIPRGSRLSLVSGFGPTFKVDYQMEKLPVIHPKSLGRVGQIAHQEFKKLQITVKTFLIIAILGLPILGGLSAVQQNAWRHFVLNLKQENRKLDQDLEKKISAIKEKDRTINENARKIDSLKKESNTLRKQNLEKEKKLESKQAVINRLKQENLENMKLLANTLDRKFNTHDVAVYFPLVTVFSDGRTREGTAFFTKDKYDTVYIATAKSLVYDEKNRQYGVALLFPYRVMFSRLDETIEAVQASISGRVKGSAFAAGKLARELGCIFIEEWLEEKKGEDGHAIAMRKVQRFPLHLIQALPYFERDVKVKAGHHVLIFAFPARAKALAAAVVRKTGNGSIRLHLPGKQDFCGAPLLRINHDGTYQVVGVGAEKGKFIKF